VGVGGAQVLVVVGGEISEVGGQPIEGRRFSEYMEAQFPQNIPNSSNLLNLEHN